MFNMTKKQVQIHNLPELMAERDKRILVIDGPFQCGKTFSIAFGFVRLIHSFDDKDVDFIVAGQRDEFVKNTMLKGMRVACEYFDLTYTPYNHSKGYALIDDHRVYAMAGATKGSGHKVRGKSVGGAWVDEVTKCDREFVLEVLGRLSVKGARMVLSTNPEGPSHWLKTDFIDKANEEGSDIERIKFEMADHPSPDPEYIATLKNRYVGAFNKRYLWGEWVAAEGYVYPDFHTVPPPEDTPPVSYDLAADFASSSVTHCNLIARYADGRAWAIDEYRYERTDPSQPHMEPRALAESIKAHVGDRTINRIIVDDAATPFKASMQAVFGGGIVQPLKMDRKGVVVGIHTTASLLSQGILNIAPVCRHTARELSNYSWEEGAEDKPVKENDHACDAIRYYAVRMVSGQRRHRPL